MNLARIGAGFAWLYTRHLLTFAIGGLLVGFETLAIAAPYMADPSPSYTVGLIMGLSIASILFCGAKIIDYVRGWFA